VDGCSPILLLGAAAPKIAPLALGEHWALTGQVIAAFALIGAAHSLAAPFSEVTSIFRSQALRFMIEFVPATLVVTSICLGGMNHWPPLNTIWLMSAAGAGGSLLGLTLLLSRLPAMINRSAMQGQGDRFGLTGGARADSEGLRRTRALDAHDAAGKEPSRSFFGAEGSAPEFVAIDGKTSRRSHARATPIEAERFD
jgi:hypothetical protein